MLQNATPLRKWAPWPPNISHEHVFCTAPATENASLQILFKSPTPAIVFGNATKPSRFAHFCDKIANPLHLPRRTTSERQKMVRTCGVFNIFDISTFSTSQLPKVVRRWCVLYILTWKCASRHNGVHFFDISTSKSGLRLRCFVHFDFDMCFAPQLRAIFHPSSSQLAPHPPLDNVKNAAILWDFFNFWTWQRQKRSNSARLPSKMESWVQSWRPRTNAFCDFSRPYLWSIAPATKKWCQAKKVLHLSHKIICPKLKIWCSKMQPLSGNQCPDLLTSLMNMSLVLRLPRKMHLSRSSSNIPHLPSFLEMLQNHHVLLTFVTRSLTPCTCHAERHLNVKKWSEHLVFLTFSTSQLFRHLNFQKWYDAGVLCTFWLGNVLRATTACTFSTCQLPKVLRGWGALYILTWKCASRHNGVHFFDISTSKSGLRLRCFVHFDFDMCFAPQLRAIFNLSSGYMAPHPLL